MEILVKSIQPTKILTVVVIVTFNINVFFLSVLNHTVSERD